MRVLALVPSLYDTLARAALPARAMGAFTSRTRRRNHSYEPFESSELHEAVYKPGQLGQKLKFVSQSLLRRFSLLSKINDYDVIYVFREAALSWAADL